VAGERKWIEHSCGACGESKWRIRALVEQHGHANFKDIALVCTGCGSVSHLVPATFIAAEWGREEEGEKSDGLVCPLPWKRDDEGRPR
jgi:hypothetical protein